ncbi:MAG: right-handed parallel beta-helix repeat-containing protein, partial [Candidatus Bilamarchaeaceae archaeon]
MDRLKRSALIFSLLIVFIPLLFFVYFADSVIELSHSEFLQQNISDDILDQNAETENNASFVVEANTSFVNIDEVVEQNISAEQNEIAPQVFSSDDNSTPPVSNFIDLDEVITQTTTEENNTSFVDIEEIIEQNTSTEQKEDVSVSTSSENTSVESITNTNEFVNLDELVSQDVSKEENQSSLVYENSNDFFIFQKNVKVEKAVYEKILSGKKERVIVVLKDGESYNNLKIEKKKLFNRNKIYVSSNIGEKELQELINSNLIESIYIDREVRASLADSDVIIRSEEARNSFGFSGDGIGICLLDTGVDLNSVNNIEGGYDFVNNDDNALDDNGHGTRMAKVINAIAPDAKIIPVKVLDSSGKGYSSTIMQGISYCLQHANDYSIKIISMSFGGGEFSGYCDYDPVVEAADYAYNNGISIIASAGNDGADYITAPACGKNVTAVSSTTKEDSVASFANINGMVDLLAPGENVNIDGNFYSGTSISAAEVSAAFALLYSYNQTLSPHQAEEMFKTSGSLVNHNDNAYTRIDVYNAILGIYTGYPSNQTVNESEPISYNYSYSIQEYNSDYNAIIAYRSNTGSGLNFPKIRFWNSTGEGSWGPEIQLPTAGSPVRWAVVKWSPISSKIVLVTLSDDGYLDGYVCMGNCTNVANWQVTNNIGQVWTTAAAQRRFDVEFETATGDAVVVYGVLSAVTTRDLAYRVLPASSSSFATTTEQYIDDTGHATDIQYSWVRLARNPRVGQEEIILVGFDLTDNHTNAWVWNGNSWGNQVSITDTATSTSGYQALAVAYAADGSKGMAIGGSGTTGDVNTRYWSGGVWSAIITFDIDPADVADVRWANLKADPASDDLQAVFIDSGSDLTTAYWSGSAWSVTPNIDTAVDVSTARCADFEWDFKGGQGYLVWDTDTTGTTLSYRLCTPQCTNPTQTTSTYAGTGAWITMYQNTKVGDTVRVLGARLNSNFDIGSFSVNSSAPTFRNYGDGAITLDTTVTTYEAYSIAFKIDRTSPSITFVSPTPANNSNIYPWDWAYINVTVVDNVNVSSVILEWNKTTNYTMNKGSGDSWYYNVTGLSTGTYEYKVYAIDFAENLNISEIRYLRLYPGCSGITTAFMCGEIVNESCQMYSNLSFNGTCFRIESSNIKINCNGFAVIGNKSGAGIAAADVQNISIINCIIGNFSSSIILSNVNHSLFRNNTLYKSTHGMLIDPSYNNTIIENTIFGNSQYGLYLDDSHNNTIRYNIFENNTDSGLRLNRSTSNLISNNSFYNNTIAIYLGMGSNSNNITENNISVGSDLVLSYESNNNRIISNRIYNTDRTLVRLEYSNNTIVENNSLSISNMKCLYLYITNQITIRNNTIMNCSEEGIYLSLPNNSVIDNNHIFNTSNGIYTYYAEWSNFTNNEIHNNSVTAVYFDFSKYLIVSNSKMYYNNYGIYSYNTSNLSLFNSNLSNNVYSGVELRYNNNVSVSDNNINSSTNGIFLYYTSSSSISNNSISSSTGILSQYSYNNLVKENNITSSNNGISIVLSNHTNFSNNIVCNNGGIGLRLAYTNQVVSFNDTFCNSGSGIEVYNSNNTNLNNTHLYGNVYFELLISSDSFAVYNLTTTNLTIDNPVGNYENYTILDIEDMYGNLTSEESYGIRWSSQPATLPNDRMSFRNKYVNITQEGGAVNIDKISWRWFDSELNGYNENMFELWKYNTSGWVRLNNTPDTVNNRLSFVNMNPLSTYAILQNNNCPLITSAGLYTQNQNYSGAPNNAAPLSGYACVKITSSNVVFDCNGYSISNNGTGGTTYGILINGSLNNITIKNCEISSYRYGVFVYNSNNTNIFNNTVKNSIDYNIYIYIAQGGLLNNNTLYNSTRGFYLYSVNASEIYNNIIFNHSAIGFYGNSITNNKIYNNSIYSNTISNLMLDSNSQNNYVLDNLIYNSSLSLYIYSSDNNTVLNNSAYNSEYGGYIYTSNYNNLTNNYFYNNVAGLFLTDSQGTYISDNIVYNNYYGFDFEDSGSAFNYINNNTVYNNTIGCLLYSVSGFKFTDNEFYNNTIGIEFSSSIFNDLLNNKFYNNSQYGVDISYTSYLNLTQSEVYNNAVGILVYVSAYVLINNTHSYNNEQLDLLVSADDNIFYNLSISNFTLDNPLGNYENYTILDIEDIYGNLTSEEAYGIRWSSQPATLPNDRMSFRNKYVNITQEGGAVNIDKISW